MSFSTDGSKLGGKACGGVYCRKLSINFSFRLPDYCSVFQAEVAAIKVAVDLLLHSVASFREVNIHSDSTTTKAALSSLSVSSRLVDECLTSSTT